MKTFDHPSVLPLLGICIDYDDEDVLKVVMPFMSNGDLRNFLKSNRLTPNNTSEYSEVKCNICTDAFWLYQRHEHYYIHSYIITTKPTLLLQSYVFMYIISYIVLL